MSGEKEMVVCQKCGSMLGQVEEIEGHEALVIDGLAVNNMRAVCLKCGQEFYWSLSERALARLIKRAKERRYN